MPTAGLDQATCLNKGFVTWTRHVSMAETRHTADQGIFREWAVGGLATFASASDGTLSLLSDVELPEYYSFVIFHVV